MNIGVWILLGATPVAQATICDTRTHGALACDGRKTADAVWENDPNTLTGYTCTSTTGGTVNGGNRPDNLFSFVCPEDGDYTFRLRTKSGALGINCYVDLFVFESCDANDCAIGTTANSTSLTVPYTCTAGQALWIAVEGDSVSTGGLGCDIRAGFTLEGRYDLWVECPEECGDGEDDDWDNLVDADDPDCCDDDGDGYEASGGTCGGDDCNDNNRDIHPGRAELVANGVDENCDGNDDCWLDGDADGYGTHVVVPGVGLGCSGGRSSNDLDCVDGGPGAGDIHPNARETTADGIDQDCDGVDDCWQDADGDGFGSAISVPGDDLDCEGAPGAAAISGDCRDAGPDAAAIFPGAAEVCNNRDDDCDLLVDDDDPGRTGGSLWYADADGDGFAGGGLSVTACTAPAGHVATPTDCLDAGPGATSVFPGAPEIAADGLDQDCDGVDHCHLDQDGDGFGGPLTGAGDNLQCGDAPGEAARHEDCVDSGPGAAGINPGAEELCSGIDEDCDGLLDDDDLVVGAPTWYRDGDGDGHPGDLFQTTACVVPPGFGATPTDCDDTAPAVSPDAIERCNGLDDDCDMLVDDDDVLDTAVAAWVDADGDGFGDPSQPLTLYVCSLPAGVVANAADCDDERPDTWPGAVEVPYDEVDQDCDGDDLDDVDVDTWPRGPDCADGDPLVHPGMPEQPDGVDEDCDGVTDDGTVRADDDVDGLAELGGDCDDQRFDVRPGLAERCDGVDENCNGVVDEATRCFDDDGDGVDEDHGDCNDADPTVGPGLVDPGGDGVDNDCDGRMTEVDADHDGYAISAGDCDDLDPLVRVGSPELENGRDDDCDGRVDEGTSTTDDDGDGASERQGDCDDTSAARGPGAVEMPGNYRDDDCDGLVDEGGPFVDDDRDGWSDDAGDCDDADAQRRPYATEVGNGVDDDCDGAIDDGVDDRDGDGWTMAAGDCDDTNGWMHPGLEDGCDGLDNDCNGKPDDTCPLLDVTPTPESKGCEHGRGPLLLGPWVLLLRRQRRGEGM